MTKTTAVVLKAVLTSAGHILFPQLNTFQEGFLEAQSQGTHSKYDLSLAYSSRDSTSRDRGGRSDESLFTHHQSCEPERAPQVLRWRVEWTDRHRSKGQGIQMTQTECLHTGEPRGHTGQTAWGHNRQASKGWTVWYNALPLQHLNSNVPLIREVAPPQQMS